MRTVTIVLTLVVALALAACGTGVTSAGHSGGAGATIAMGASSFTGKTMATIKAGQSITFDDSSAGGVHDLVTGTGGKLLAAAGAPSELASSDGVDFKPGDKKTLTFSHPGTYHITCTLHPSMQVTIIVTP